MSISKVAKAKESMGFQKKGPSCGNCRWFSSEIKQVGGHFDGYYKYKQEVNIRCHFDVTTDFSVDKSNWCKRYEPKGRGD